MNAKYRIITVRGLSPIDLEVIMNEMYEKGFIKSFESNISWYQGKGDDGIICFERNND
jgi:hypothetical protein